MWTLTEVFATSELQLRLRVEWSSIWLALVILADFLLHQLKTRRNSTVLNSTWAERGSGGHWLGFLCDSYSWGTGTQRCQDHQAAVKKVSPVHRWFLIWFHATRNEEIAKLMSVKAAVFSCSRRHLNVHDNYDDGPQHGESHIQAAPFSAARSDNKLE